MYIVRDRSTRKIIHVNPAPLSQRLEGVDIFHRFDPAAMEIGKSDESQVPPQFDIDANGFIIPRTSQPLAAMAEGIRDLTQKAKLPPRQLFDDERCTLRQYKDAVIDLHTQRCLAARRAVLPDHELLYAAIGALDPARVERYRATVAAYVQALEQVKSSIEQAASADEVDAVPPAYTQLPPFR